MIISSSSLLLSPELIRFVCDDLALDASHDDLFSQNATCKCFFFDNLGKLNPKRLEDATDRRFNDVLRRRFFRQGNFLAFFGLICLLLFIQYFDIVSKIVDTVRYRERRRRADNAVNRKRLLGTLLLDRGIVPLKYALLSAIFSAMTLVIDIIIASKRISKVILTFMKV